MDIGSMSGIVFMLIVLVTLFGIIPLATKKGMMNAVQQDEDDGEPVSLRPAEAACEGDGFRSIEDSGVVESEITEINRDAHQHDGGSHMDGAARRITQDYIDSVREKRRKAIRRRRAVAGILAVLAVVLAAIGVVYRVFLLCALIPAAVLAAVLFLGAHAASQARKWEDTVHAVKNRPAWESTRRHTLNHNIHMVSAGARDFGGPSEEFETETDAMSQMEIQEALTLAIREQGTAIRRRSLKEAGSSHTPAAYPYDDGITGTNASVNAASTDTSIPEAGGTEDTASSFEVSASDTFLSSTAAAVSSREIISRRQVARAVPPADPPAIPSSDMAAGVQAPIQTSDSLGTDIDAVIERRQFAGSKE